MARRTFRTAKQGQCYCVEWPEWHVDCAGEGCDQSFLIAELGEATTSQEAELRMRRAVEEGKASGWGRKSGLWYCPTCKVKL